MALQVDPRFPIGGVPKLAIEEILFVFSRTVVNNNNSLILFQIFLRYQSLDFRSTNRQI